MARMLPSEVETSATREAQCSLWWEKKRLMEMQKVMDKQLESAEKLNALEVTRQREINNYKRLSLELDTLASLRSPLLLREGCGHSSRNDQDSQETVE